MKTTKIKTDEYLNWLESVNPKGAEELKKIIETYETECKNKSIPTLYEKKNKVINNNW